METILDLLSTAPVIVIAGVATMIVAVRDLVGGEVPPHPHRRTGGELSPHPHRQAGGLARHRRTSAAHLRAYTVVLGAVFLMLVTLRFGHLGA
jgi:hypothetical protein